MLSCSVRASNEECLQNRRLARRAAGCARGGGYVVRYVLLHNTSVSMLDAEMPLWTTCRAASALRPRPAEQRRELVAGGGNSPGVSDTSPRGRHPDGRRPMRRARRRLPLRYWLRGPPTARDRGLQWTIPATDLRRQSWPRTTRACGPWRVSHSRSPSREGLHDCGQLTNAAEAVSGLLELARITAASGRTGKTDLN